MKQHIETALEENKKQIPLFMAFCPVAFFRTPLCVAR